MKKFVGLAALGVVAVFLALPTPAAARFIGRYNGWGSRAIVFGGTRYRLYDWYASPGYFGAWRRADYYPYAGSYYYPYGEYSYSAYYPQDPPEDVNAATIHMSVPGGAQVWFDGAATAQSGADRVFVSPPLTPGREYVYHVRVQWSENNKAVERNRDVTLRAGERVNLNIDK
jgi:uncharacterized protein (TIGR03000 family)